MSGQDHLLFIRDYLCVFGGVAAIIFGLSKFLSVIWIKRQIEKERQENRKEIEEIKKGNQIFREKLMSRYALYSEAQFKIYNDLWGALYDLESKAVQLLRYDQTKQKHLLLNDFLDELDKTKQLIHKNALLIETVHYKKIESLYCRISSLCNDPEDFSDKRNTYISIAVALSSPVRIRKESLTKEQREKMDLLLDKEKLQEYQIVLQEIMESLRRQIRGQEV